MAEQEALDLHSELGELLNAIRVALPGVQVLFAFLLAIPFSNRFNKVTSGEKTAYYGALICAATASLLLIAPSAHHRLHWRKNVEMRALVWANRLLLLGGGFLALAMVGALYFITDVLFGLAAALPVAVVFAVACAAIWYALPLAWREKSTTPPGSIHR